MSKNLFHQLLYIFYASSMQAMGKIKNPVSDKIEVNIEQAKQAVEMLEMIKEKTKNNLDKEEETALNSFLSEIRLNYVDVLNKAN